MYSQLEENCVFNNGNKYIIYGDPAYPLTELLLCPFPTNRLTQEQQNFNFNMSTVRQVVEWGFGKVTREFAFLDFSKNQKLLLQDLGSMYSVGVLLTNCHTCLYGSQANDYFSSAAPSLEEYLCM